MTNESTTTGKFTSETYVGISVGNGGKCGSGSPTGDYCENGYCCNKGTCHKQNPSNNKCYVENKCEPDYGYCYGYGYRNDEVTTSSTIVSTTTSVSDEEPTTTTTTTKEEANITTTTTTDEKPATTTTKEQTTTTTTDEEQNSTTTTTTKEQTTTTTTDEEPSSTTTTTTKEQTTTTTTDDEQNSTTTTTITTKEPSPSNSSTTGVSSSLTTDGNCGSSNGKQCLDAQCCNGGNCVNMHDYSETTDYDKNVLLVLDTSSVNMSDEDISKLNSLLSDISSQLNSDIEIPYITFASSADEYEQSDLITVSRTTSSEANFASALGEAIRFYKRYGKKRNGNPNIVVIYSAGNIVSSSFGSALSEAVNQANALKESGVEIYALNVNSGARPGSAIATVGSTVDSNDINTVMELLSSDYSNVSVDSNGTITSYSKSSSEYYRTPKSGDYTVMYNDILYESVESNDNPQCEIDNGCET
ncbi:hypothetical protein PIROE2DRAFT_19201, partial [Piromyces sp. E2]